jgi:hypothetical protein
MLNNKFSNDPSKFNDEQKLKEQYFLRAVREAKFKTLEVKTIRFDKKIAVIYNPNSGKRINYIPLITKRLNY